MSEKITAKMVGDLRESTGAGLMDCKKALVESSGDIDKAIEILRKKGVASAAKKAGRDASEGLIESYIHLGGKVGVLCEINCESDFVAKTDDFKQFVRDIAMHVAAASPVCVSREEIDPDLLEKGVKWLVDKQKESLLKQLRKSLKARSISTWPRVVFWSRPM